MIFILKINQNKQYIIVILDNFGMLQAINKYRYNMLKKKYHKHSVYFTNSPLFKLYQSPAVSKLPVSEYLH